MNKIELVVPAGGYEQMKSAVLAGADSIYAGFDKYSARAYADNFNLKNLEKASIFCHSNDVKLYLALNTIIKEDELYDLIDFIDEITDKIEIDAFIIQDLALLKIIHNLAPKIPVHASTQMNTHNSFSAEFLKNLGVKRIILAREMTIREIAEIVRRNIADIEIFCHGSQCYSYSGQCYFSSSVGQRSGNRGTCPQPCRMRYRLIDKENSRNIDQEGFFLSKCDLSLIEKLPEIINAGIRALKIEGRMKTPEYVAIVTSIYRKYIDIFYDGIDYTVDNEDIQKLKQVFSRKLNWGYFYEKYPKNIISDKKSGSTGNLFGRISGLEIGKDKKVMIIDSEMNLKKDDILEIWTKKGNERIRIKNFIRKIGKNKNIKKAKYKIETDKKIFFAIGDRVFRYFDKSLDEEIEEILKRSPKSNDRIRKNKEEKESCGISVKKKALKDLKGSIIHNDPDKKEKIYRTVSSFEADNFISLIVSNIDYFNYIIREINSFKNKFPENSGIQVNLILDLFNIDRKAYVEKNKTFTERLLDFNYLNKNNNINFYFATPPIAYDDYISDIFKSMENLIQHDFCNFYISNYSFLYFLYKLKEYKDKIISIILAHNLNITNSFALAELVRTKPQNIFIKEIIFSTEITIEEINNTLVDFYGKILNKNDELFLPAASLYSYGYLPIMNARVRYDFSGKKDNNICLMDKKNFSFMVKNNFMGNTVIFNSKKHNLISETGNMIQKLVNGFVIDAGMLKIEEVLFALNSFYEVIKINRLYMKNYFDRNKILKAEKEEENFIKGLLDSKYFKDFTKGNSVKKII